jgi:hypothetical protein
MHSKGGGPGTHVILNDILRTAFFPLFFLTVDISASQSLITTTQLIQSNNLTTESFIPTKRQGNNTLLKENMKEQR